VPLGSMYVTLPPTRRQLERMMTRYNVPTAYIDGRVVAGLASDEINAAKLSNVQLLECVANVDQVTPDPFCVMPASPHPDLWRCSPHSPGLPLLLCGPCCPVTSPGHAVRQPRVGVLHV
jgi:hypothetical protein